MVQTPGEKDENLVWLADYVQTNDPNADRYYPVSYTHLLELAEVHGFGNIITVAAHCGELPRA